MISPEKTSSFFINKENSRYLKLEDILPQSQLPSNKKIDVLAKAVHNIILNNGNDYDLTEDQKKLLQKTNNDINESHFKKKLEDRFLEYKSPNYTSSSLKEANLVYRQHRRGEVEKINETRKRNSNNDTFYPIRFNDKDETNLRNYSDERVLCSTPQSCLANVYT